MSHGYRLSGAKLCKRHDWWYGGAGTTASNYRECPKCKYETMQEQQPQKLIGATP